MIHVTPQGKKRYKALEKIGMYCMYFNIKTKVECRYKIYTAKRLGMDKEINPLLTISLFSDEGIETFYYAVEIVNIKKK